MTPSFRRNLAAAFLSGNWTVDGLVERGTLACGECAEWLEPLVRRVLKVFSLPPLDLDLAPLDQYLAADEELARAWWCEYRRAEAFPRQIFWLTPTTGLRRWPVSALPTPGALAVWLGLTTGELDWFADCQGREGNVGSQRLRHYTYRWLACRSGKARLLEAPKQRLKSLQRRLLHELLEHIPPHEAVHGYRPGRSIVSYVAPHAGQPLVLRFDLCDFFPSIRSSRVHALFRSAGYPHAVARLLTGLCTNVVPSEVWRSKPPTRTKSDDSVTRQVFLVPHLPQGAPTSPALANLCAFHLDCRLAALATRVGARYTRYADDLAFSGGDELKRCARRFQVGVCLIALEEGFEVHTRKTRFMHQSVRQQLCGIVVNAHPNMCRREYDRLKAILCNCIHYGPHSQDREGHSDFRAYLMGRVAYVAMLNAARGKRLQAMFERISWSSSP
jgi:hypothetical protein